MTPEATALLKVLEAGSYNAKPTKLRQGTMTAFYHNPDDTLRDLTEEEWNELWEKVEKERGPKMHNVSGSLPSGDGTLGL